MKTTPASKGLIAILALTTAVNIGIAAGNYRIMAAGSAPAAFGSLEFDPNAKSTLVAPPAADAKANASDAEIDALVGNVSDNKTAPSVNEDDIRRIVRDEINTNPKFVMDALNAYMQKQQADEAASADQKVVEKAAAVTEDKGYPFVGNKDGKVELFYYFDVNCGFCKKIDGELRRFVDANPDVKLVHREMPILTPASTTAAHIGGTLFALYPEAYPKFHDILLGHPQASTPDDIDAALRDAVGKEKADEVIAKSFNVTEDGVAKDVDARIKATLSTATDAGINGTPFIYVKGANSFVRGAAPDLFDRLKAAADIARK
ncbi:DsbA family protein [Rhizobium sp. BK176]|uniref:DsbA family protein n=1 Tax=Rhizobium sp. BK176 TaxID=2587071 RepID=UPI0021675A72|nr:thioredoxin domain-containing protein [Rhizobium sp. BK176]MCS4088979.1 protein-disulfide isomerase [Rhizobium sp. BK176]